MKYNHIVLVMITSNASVALLILSLIGYVVLGHI